MKIYKIIKVVHRDVAPAAGFQAHIAQHLTGGKEFIPGVIPREGEVGGAAREVGIVTGGMTVDEAGRKSFMQAEV